LSRSIVRWALLLACLTGWCSSGASAEQRIYQIHYGAEFRPAEGVAAVTIRVEQPAAWLRALTFTAPPDRYRRFEGDGTVRVSGNEVTWRVPKRGGELRFLHVVDHRRDSGGYDARMTSDWAVLKADKLFPPAAARTVRDARAAATLELTGPDGWLFQTRYGRLRGRTAFEDPERNFDRPTGWMVLGHIAARREDIAGRYVLVTSPAGQGFRHNDVMAFMQWNLPVIVSLLPSFPDRLLIVGAGADMWRGGLSGAASLYVHGERPLISQNGTSPILHELIHVGSRLSGDRGGDWIVEGLAEFYGLEVLRRSGTISASRYAAAFTHLERWAERDGGCLAKALSSGPNTARAVLVLRRLDQEIRDRTRQRSSLDDVLRRLVETDRAVSETGLRVAVEDLIGGDSRVLADLPRCR